MNRRQQNDPRASCEGKKQFSSYEAATQVQKHRKNHDSPSLAPYRCRLCHFFHLGRPDRAIPAKLRFRRTRDKQHEFST